MVERTSRTVAGFTAWAATYDQTIAKEVEQYSGMPYEEVLERVCEACAPAPGERVLDVGTGTGALALRLAQRLNGGDIVGIDPTAAMLQRARENAQRTGLAHCVSFEQAPAEEMPFANASFDVAVSSIAMHHTTVRRSLAEIVRVLKPGGRLVIADMAANAKWESAFGVFLVPLLMLYYLVSKRSWKVARSELQAYKQLFLKGEWEEMLRELGLRDATVQAFPHPGSTWCPGILLIRASKGT